MELLCNYILLDLLKNHKDLCEDYLKDAAYVTTSIYVYYVSNLELTGEGLNINNININKLNNVIPYLYKKDDIEFNRKSLIRLLENLIKKEAAIYNEQKNKVHKIIGNFINEVETMVNSVDNKKERSID